MPENKKFYFTYGSTGMPYDSGWTIIEAPDKQTACGIFRAFHPDKIKGVLNCAFVYSEDEFHDTTMSGPNGSNFGRQTCEVITTHITRYDVFGKEIKDEADKA